MRYVSFPCVLSFSCPFWLSSLLFVPHAVEIELLLNFPLDCPMAGHGLCYTSAGWPLFASAYDKHDSPSFPSILLSHFCPLISSQWFFSLTLASSNPSLVTKGWKGTFPYTWAVKRHCWTCWKAGKHPGAADFKTEIIKYSGYRAAQINLKKWDSSSSVSDMRRVNCSLGSTEEQFPRKRPWNVKEQGYQNRSLLTNGCLFTQSKCTIWGWILSVSVY